MCESRFAFQLLNPILVAINATLRLTTMVPDRAIPTMERVDHSGQGAGLRNRDSLHPRLNPSHP